MSTSVCSRCRYPCAYPDAEWYPPGVIRYCPPQVKFLVASLPALEDGIYPRDPHSNYVGGKSGRNERAPHQTPLELAAEVTWRLDRTGKDGKLLLAYSVLGNWALDDDAKHALAYVSGWRRKLTPYIDWLRQRERRRGERLATSP